MLSQIMIVGTCAGLSSRWLSGVAAAFTLCAFLSSPTSAQTAKPGQAGQCPDGCYTPNTLYPIVPIVGVEAGGGWSGSTFNVTPPFDVNGSGFIGGINGSLLFTIPGTNIATGPRISFIGGNIARSNSGLPASPLNYGTTTKTIFTWEDQFDVGSNYLNKSGDVMVAMMGAYMTAALVPSLGPGSTSSNNLNTGSNLTDWKRWVFGASFGGATVNTTVTGTGGGVFVQDSITRTGFTTALNAQYALSKEMAATMRLRWIFLPKQNFNVPGTVSINENMFLVTIGLDWLPLGPTGFNAPSPR